MKTTSHVFAIEVGDKVHYYFADTAHEALKNIPDGKLLGTMTPMEFLRNEKKYNQYFNNLLTQRKDKK